MASSRPSSTRLLVLGVLRYLQPVHGYDVRRELSAWNVDSWSELRSGSIYHALSAMAREELIESVDAPGGRPRGRPARIRYRLTGAGEREYQRLLHEQWWSYASGTDPFFAAFAFAPDLPPVEAEAALRHRAGVLRDMRERLRSGAVPTGAAHVAEMFELIAARLTAEIDWCERVATRAGAGAFLPPCHHRDADHDAMTS